LYELAVQAAAAAAMSLLSKLLQCLNHHFLRLKYVLETGQMACDVKEKTTVVSLTRD